MNQKAINKSKYTFLKNDKLNEEAKNACKVLHIDPNFLQIKTKDSFKKEAQSDDIADLRYYHYEGKRKALLEEIFEYLKSSTMKATNNSFLRR